MSFNTAANSLALVVVTLMSLLPLAYPAVLGTAMASDGPYGHAFCPHVDPATQSPLAIVKRECKTISHAPPINHTWLDHPLPMDLATGMVKIPGPVSVKLSNETIYVNFEPNRFFLFHDGLNYSMAQMHIHLPAEHSVDGSVPVMELHIVHLSKNNDVAVLGFLYKMGAPSPFFETLITHLPEPTVNGSKTVYKPGEVQYPDGVGILAQEWAQLENTMAGPFFSYNGSLTTPPCDVGVHWVVFENNWGLTLSRDQIMRFQKILYDVSGATTFMNARLPFPMNNRTVEYHDVDASRAVYNAKIQNAVTAKEGGVQNGGPAARKLLVE